MHGMDLWKWLFHLGSPFVCSLILLADFHTQVEGAEWSNSAQPLPWQRPWDGDRSGQQRSALSMLQAVAYNLGLNLGLMG